MTQMKKDQILDCVREVVDTGRDIRAVGEHHYVVEDADLTQEAFAAAEAELGRIWSKHGKHRHLKREIIRYLHLSVGATRHHQSSSLVVGALEEHVVYSQESSGTGARLGPGGGWRRSDAKDRGAK
jgi:hypothetical protein